MDALSKSVTKMARTNLDKCVWSLGQDCGTCMLATHPACNGVVLSYAGRQWRSNQHPKLTLQEAGIHKSGEALFFVKTQVFKSKLGILERSSSTWTYNDLSHDDYVYI